MNGLLSQMNPAMTFGGTDLYQQAPYVDPNLPVYRPDRDSSGLLNDAEMDNLTRSFAGGLLNGYQYDPTGNFGGSDPANGGQYFRAIEPSGIYTADPEQGVSTETPTGPTGPSVFDAARLMYGSNPRGPRGGGGDGVGGILNATSADDIADNYREAFGVDVGATYDPSDPKQRKFFETLQRDYQADESP